MFVPTIAPAVVLAVLSAVHAPDAPEPVRRAVAVGRIRAEFKRDEAVLARAIRAGKIVPDAAGEYPGWRELQKATAAKLRPVITADPADRAGHDALMFAVGDLRAAVDDPELLKLILKHHLAARDLWRVIHHNGTDDTEFLKTIAAKSPTLDSRGRAFVVLTEWYTVNGRQSEALATLTRMKADAPLGTESGFQGGTWHDTADRMRFEIEQLPVGKPLPAFAGVDLDGEPMTLADYQGKVTFVVFWATWCGPCMEAVPHEVALVKKYTGRPFAVVGVNGDTTRASLPKGSRTFGEDGKEIDDTLHAKKVIADYKITWRSFASGQSGGLAAAWNVRSWPTAYLVGHDGIIRGKWKGMPEDKELDAAVEKWVAFAEKK